MSEAASLSGYSVGQLREWSVNENWDKYRREYMGELYRLASADYISEFSDKRKVLSIALLEQMKNLADSLSCDYTDGISNLSAGKNMTVPQRWRALEEGVGILERLRCLSIDGVSGEGELSNAEQQLFFQVSVPSLSHRLTNSHYSSLAK